jgi:hypothetical protein
MTDKAISQLRRRVIEDMTIRKLAPKIAGQLVHSRRGSAGQVVSFVLILLQKS